MEFVGPAGSGKTAILSELKARHAADYGYIGRPRPSLARRLVAAVEALPTALSLNRLGIGERRRLYQAHRSLAAGRAWLNTLPPGIHLIDEGPYRVLHDYACTSERQLAVWRKIAKRQLRRLSGHRVVIVHIRAEPELRKERRQQRMSALEMRDPNFNINLPPRKDRLRFLRDDIGRWTIGNPLIRRADVDNNSDLPDASERVHSMLLENRTSTALLERQARNGLLHCIREDGS